MDKKIYILSGTAQEARDWAVLNWCEDRYMFIDTIDRIKGLIGCQYACTGDYLARDDWAKVTAELKALGGVNVTFGFSPEFTP
jgi:hypothetical protein